MRPSTIYCMNCSTGMIAMQKPGYPSLFSVLLTVLALLVVAAIEYYHYLLFHAIIELAAIAVAWGIFFLAWNAREHLRNQFLLFLGIAYLFVGWLDLIHTLSYKGMNILSDSSANPATQLWIAARGVEVFSLVLAFFFTTRRVKTGTVFLSYASISVVLLLSIFQWKVFPVCFADAPIPHLTRFKLGSEYAFCLILAGAAVELHRQRSFFDPKVLQYLMGSVLVTILSELSFTLYDSPYGALNALGHILKIVSFYLIYKAVIETGIRQPHRLVLREIKQEEERMRRERDQSEERLQTIIAHAPIVLTVVDQTGRVILHEGAHRRRSDPDEGELPGKDIFKVLEKRPALAESWRQALAGQEITSLVQSSGEGFFQVAYRGVHTPDGTLVGAMAVATDVTEREKAQAAFAQRNAALQAVYSIATRLDHSLQGICDEATHQLAGLLKVPCVAIRRLDRNLLKTLSKFHRGRIIRRGFLVPEREPCGMVIREQEVKSFLGDLRSQFPHSECLQERPFRSYIGVPIRGVETRVLGLVCAMDYQERVFSEDERHLIEIFARYVALEIEREAMSARLLTAEKLRVLGQVASSVAHEVRNPLNAILVTAEVLEKSLKDQAQFQPYLDRIRRQVQRLSNLMNDLLELRRPVEPGALQPKSLVKVCRTAVEIWKQSQPSLMHTIRFDPAPEAAAWAALVDPERIAQVFINLLENAAQHSREDGEIRLSLLQTGDSFAVIRIADQGTGIPEEDLPRIFDPFFTTRRSGSGLGLTIVKHLVEAHRGSIIVSNNAPPPGCTVEIQLPLIRETPT
ncbi:MAG: MASE3 domain-containing protein [Planctomycetota bacterium]